MAERDRILEVVGLVYEAAVEPARWPVALTRLSDLVASSAATLLFGDATAADAAIMESARVDPADLKRYNEHYFKRDVRLHAGMARPAGTVTINSNLMRPGAFRRTEFFNDFLEPVDLPYMIGSVLLKEDDAFASLGIHRPRRRGEYTPAEIEVFGAVVPHLRRAISIHRRLSCAELRASAGAEALDRLKLGVVLMDAEGRPLLVNRSAREILDERDGLVLRKDGLHACHAGGTRALAVLVHEAGRTALGTGTAAGGAMALPRPSMKRDLAVLVAPIRVGEVELMPSAAVAAVFLSDPERGTDTAPVLLQRLYGLTPAEARLAALLVEGRTVADAAKTLQVRPLTARTQLKSVLAKTGTNRQSQLIRLIMSGPAQLRPI
jgi:DNA-binding CsgD family transcriptional regulator